MRIVLPAVVFVLTATALHATPALNTKTQSADIDPIVTGQNVTDAQKAAWQKEHQAWLDCGKCVPDQPFPFDD